jgi:hypothetical protein
MELPDYLKSVIDDIAATSTAFAANYAAETPIHAAPFFGQIDTASYATVGLNPSPAEFRNSRWHAQPLPLSDHLSRLLNYFHNPQIPYYASWFDWWERALGSLGRSYFRDTVHLDLSARATIPVGNCPDKRIFVRMIQNDIKWFFRLLSNAPQLRGLLVAGSSWSITRNDAVGAVYLDRVIRDTAAANGFTLTRVTVLKQSNPRIALYRLRLPNGRMMPLFFCGASPSSNTPETLIQCIQSQSKLLKHNGF